MVVDSGQRDLLFGLLALQNGGVSRDALLDALAEWLLESKRSLGEILVDRKSLTSENQAFLDRLVDGCSTSREDKPRVPIAEPGASAVMAALMATHQGDADAPTRESTHITDVSSNGVFQPSADRYTVLRPHARGGLGQVSVAMDRELNREVAVKELLDHAADSKEARARFLREAEVTSQLEHPGVVPVYGLGVSAKGKPYYAMRFIKGTTLQQAIDQLHAKSSVTNELVFRRQFRELLRRLIAVCETMAFAHARGIIHRDLKPLNVMLGEFGETLIVDWGLAKTKAVGNARAVDHESNTRQETDSKTEAKRCVSGGTLSNAQLTQMGQMLGTPAYMSPEQAAGQWDQLGPASDIFSLGAMLYAILTGQPPFVGNRGQVLDQSRAGSWTPARQINANSPLALDAVCHKAMAFDPTARYGSAKELAVEIDRWLSDEPVTAWREPLLVRLGRWARRRRGWVAATSALLVTSVVALAIGLLAVDRERRNTLIQQEHTRAALDDMLAPESLDWLKSQQSLLPQQRKFLERALGYYQEFASSNAKDKAGRQLLAKAHTRVATILTMLGRYQEAESSFRQALTELESVASVTNENPQNQYALALNYHEFADLLHTMAKNSESESFSRKSIAALEELVASHPDNRDYRGSLASCIGTFGLQLKEVGRLDEAKPYYEEAMRLLKALVADYPDAAEYRNTLAQNGANLAHLLSASGKKPQAETAFQESIAVQEKLVTDYPGVGQYRLGLAHTYNNLGILFKDLGEYTRAETAYRRALAIRDRLATDFPAVPEYRDQVGYGCLNLGVLLENMGKIIEAEAAFRRGIAIYEKLNIEFPAAPKFRRVWALNCLHLATNLGKQNKPAAAEAEFRRALDIQTKLANDFPDVLDHHSDVAATWNNFANYLRRGNKRAEAESGFRQAAQTYSYLVTKQPEVTEYRLNLAKVESNIGLLLLIRGEYTQAVEQCTSAIAAFDKILAAQPRLVEALSARQEAIYTRADAFGHLGQHDDALIDWNMALDANLKAEAEIRGYRAMTLVKLKRGAEAMADVDGVVAHPKARPIDIYNAACVCSQLFAAVPDDPTAAKRAVELLRIAIEKGYDAKGKLLSDPDLTPLRDREDFRKLVSELADKSTVQEP
jgi:serine/threonine-protein kinase